HFDLLHIAFNMFALVYFGRLDEVGYSRSEYLAIYLGAGLVGNAASLYLLPSNVPTGGASGAIFGLVGAYVASERKGGNMKAVRFHRHGGPEVLQYEDAPDPVRKGDEVLLRVKACALNRLDIWERL